jgi:hypothetical protein
MLIWPQKGWTKRFGGESRRIPRYTIIIKPNLPSSAPPKKKQKVQSSIHQPDFLLFNEYWSLLIPQKFLCHRQIYFPIIYEEFIDDLYWHRRHAVNDYQILTCKEIIEIWICIKYIHNFDVYEMQEIDQ